MRSVSSVSREEDPWRKMWCEVSFVHLKPLYFVSIVFESFLSVTSSGMRRELDTRRRMLDRFETLRNLCEDYPFLDSRTHFIVYEKLSRSL